METNENFLLNLSILYRNIMKYFDHVLAKYDIGSGQIIFLTFINENEGCTMQDVTRVCEVDKGTTTKSISRLIDQGYVMARNDEHDRRSKRLYTTKEANVVMNAIYQYRNECRKIVGKDVDFDAFNEMMAVVTDNARNVLEESEDLSSLKIGGLLKTTLLDYPGKVACTIFTSGCSYKCPFCHNRDLVYIPENYQFLDADEIFQFLDKRKNILDGVCISGGEPLMQEKLTPFLKEIKKRGYKIKLDVTGNYLNRLKEIVDVKLVDYIAMDVKNTKGKYALTVGSETENFPVESIDACISFIRTCGIPYEFRTTIVRELHTKEDLIAMAKWLKGADAWYLQQFQDSPNCIQEGFHSYNKQEMLEILEAVKQYVPKAEVRGIKED